MKKAIATLLVCSMATASIAGDKPTPKMSADQITKSTQSAPGGGDWVLALMLAAVFIAVASGGNSHYYYAKKAY